MLISELFFSIQGEGKRAGFPSFFIRTNFCNLRCKFSGGNLCDSAYTSWEPNDKSNIGEMSVEEIVDAFARHKIPDINLTGGKELISGSPLPETLLNEKSSICCNIVITGGEPTIQGGELALLCKKLKSEFTNIHITLETNGTKTGDFLKNIDLASVSPKLKSSIPYSTKFAELHDKKRTDINSLKIFHKYHQEGLFDIQWKFVFCDEDDIEEIIDLQKKVGFRNEDVFLMPEGTTKAEIESKRNNLVQVCMKYNFNYSDRLHILIWGNERGR
jgi:7-carboxy-7-deazaguanine synthase